MHTHSQRRWRWRRQRALVGVLPVWLRLGMAWCDGNGPCSTCSGKKQTSLSQPTSIARVHLLPEHRKHKNNLCVSACVCARACVCVCVCTRCAGAAMQSAAVHQAHHDHEGCSLRHCHLHAGSFVAECCCGSETSAFTCACACSSATAVHMAVEVGSAAVAPRLVVVPPPNLTTDRSHHSCSAQFPFLPHCVGPTHVTHHTHTLTHTHTDTLANVAQGTARFRRPSRADIHRQ